VPIDSLEAAASATLLTNSATKFIDAPNVVRDSRLHRRRDAQW